MGWRRGVLSSELRQGLGDQVAVSQKVGWGGVGGWGGALGNQLGVPQEVGGAGGWGANCSEYGMRKLGSGADQRALLLWLGWRC